MTTPVARPGQSQLGELFLSTWHEGLGWHGYSPDRPRRTGARWHRPVPLHPPRTQGSRGPLWSGRPAPSGGRRALGRSARPLSGGRPARIAAALAGREQPSFGDLGMQMLRGVVGDLLLRIELPVSFPGLYVADFAHPLECPHYERRGRAPLGRATTAALGTKRLLDRSPRSRWAPKILLRSSVHSWSNARRARMQTDAARLGALRPHGASSH